jgi:hypothetical protein
MKSLGVILDRKLTFNQHVNSVVKACNYHIRALRFIRPALDRNTANTIACSIVGSRLDYCNSLLNGTSQANIAKLQRVQNTLARVVSGANMRNHITPVLKNLHWLPISVRIEYKVALLTHQVLTTSQPEYLRDTVSLYVPGRDLRSSSQQLVSLRRTYTATGRQSLNYAASTVWSSLSAATRSTHDVKMFKRVLKTELFRRHYDT